GVALEGERLLARLRIPDLDGLVPRTGNQAFAVRAEDHVVDPCGVPLEGGESLASLGVPHLQRVASVGDQALAIRAEQPHATTAFECDEYLASLGIPHLPISTGQALAVRAEDHADGIALEGEQLLTRPGIQHLFMDGQALAVRAELYGYATGSGGDLHSEK